MRVSWAGLLENAECADTIKVKFWPLSAPSGYTVLPRRGLGADTTAFTVTGLSQYQRYAFQVPSHCRQFLITVSTNVSPLPGCGQVSAVEEQTALRSVDWNRSPIAEFGTSSRPQPQVKIVKNT